MNEMTKRSRFGAAVVGLLLALVALARSYADDWPMYGHGPRGNRVNGTEQTLGPNNVANLGVVWTYPTESVVCGTPVVVGNTVFAGDNSGNVYALSADNGQLQWQTALPGAAFTATAIVVKNRVVIGDIANGFIYGLNKTTGQVVWQIQPNTSGNAAVWGSGTLVGNNVAIGYAANADLPVPDNNPRGSLVLLDPTNGQVIWQTYTISDADYGDGNQAAGAGIWTTPAYDGAGTIYVGTGNNFSEPTTSTSDAIIAFDANTGQIKWVTQCTPDDAFNDANGGGPNYDFGDSPQLYTLGNGQLVVGAGQKSGFYHVLDAATGNPINQNQFLPGGDNGGFFPDSGVANGVVFATGNNPETSQCALIAIKGNGSRELWRFETDGVETNGVAIANGVVYFKPSSGPNLYAFSTTDGTLLATVPIYDPNSGQYSGSNSGVSISNGRIFLGLGNVFVDAFDAPGGIVALSLP